MSEFFLFMPRARRMKRFGKYHGLPAEVLHTDPDGLRLVICGGQRFSSYPDELKELTKPIHGSPQNYRFNNDGTLRE